MEAQSIADLSTDLFLLAMQFRTATQSGDFDSLVADTRKVFADFEEKCSSRRLPEEEVRSAKYALAAFIDETILHSRCLHKERWADNPLQLEYFGTYLAGEAFFDYLEEIRRQGASRPDLLEVYYLCLLLGFKGKYGVSDSDKLPMLIDTVAAELQRFRTSSFSELSPHGRIPDSPQAAPSDRLPRWVVYSCWGISVFALLLYLAMFWGVHSGARSLQERIPFQVSLLKTTGHPNVGLRPATAAYFPLRARA